MYQTGNLVKAQRWVTMPAEHMLCVVPTLCPLQPGTLVLKCLNVRPFSISVFFFSLVKDVQNYRLLAELYRVLFWFCVFQKGFLYLTLPQTLSCQSRLVWSREQEGQGERNLLHLSVINMLLHTDREFLSSHIEMFSFNGSTGNKNGNFIYTTQI